MTWEPCFSMVRCRGLGTAGAIALVTVGGCRTSTVEAASPDVDVVANEGGSGSKPAVRLALKLVREWPACATCPALASRHTRVFALSSQRLATESACYDALSGRTWSGAWNIGELDEAGHFDPWVELPPFAGSVGMDALPSDRGFALLVTSRQTESVNMPFGKQLSPGDWLLAVFVGAKSSPATRTLASEFEDDGGEDFGRVVAHEDGLVSYGCVHGGGVIGGVAVSEQEQPCLVSGTDTALAPRYVWLKSREPGRSLQRSMDVAVRDDGMVDVVVAGDSLALTTLSSSGREKKSVDDPRIGVRSLAILENHQPRRCVLVVEDRWRARAQRRDEAWEAPLRLRVYCSDLSLDSWERDFSWSAPGKPSRQLVFATAPGRDGGTWIAATASSPTQAPRTWLLVLDRHLTLVAQSEALPGRVSSLTSSGSGVLMSFERSTGGPGPHGEAPASVCQILHALLETQGIPTEQND